jgi:transposase InsO family protein
LGFGRFGNGNLGGEADLDCPEPARTDPGNGTEESDLGEERIANELFLELGVRVSLRTVRKYLSPTRPGNGPSDQRWATFLRNHARAVVACDFLVSVTALFQVLYVFVAMEIGSRRILHCDLTDRPTAEWTTQQFREILADRHPYKFVVHDRDSIFSSLLDRTLEDFGVRVLRTPIQATKANAYCERLIGTIRRECLDYVIPSTRAICG